MFKKRANQLIYKFIIILVGGFFNVYNSGLVQGKIDLFSFLQFSYISNVIYYIYFVFDFLYALVDELVGKTESKKNAFPFMKFNGIMMIFFTFIIANTLQGETFGYFYQLKYWQNPTNYSYHFVLPILYSLDYIFFSEHEVKLYYPIASLFIPIAYFIAILVRAEIVGRETYQGLLYPYELINVNTYGYPLTIFHIFLFMLVYAAVCFLPYFWKQFVTAIRKAIKERKEMKNSNRANSL